MTEAMTAAKNDVFIGLKIWWAESTGGGRFFHVGCNEQSFGC